MCSGLVFGVVSVCIQYRLQHDVVEVVEVVKNGDGLPFYILTVSV